MPHLDASALDRDVDGVALLSAVLGIPMPARPRPQLQILVVESDRLVRESISIQLHAKGAVVFEADTGERALAILQGGQAVDVLLTEVEMSAGPEGWALAEEARRRHPSMAVIYTSAQPRGLACQASGSLFVVKPYRTEQILEAVQLLTQGPHMEAAAEQRETSTGISLSEGLLEAA